MAAHFPHAQPPIAEDPGRTLGLVGLILAFLGCLAPVGLIMSIVARSRSRKAGHHNALATVGIIVGILVTLGSVISAIVIGVGIGTVASACAELGPGVHRQGATTITCS